jgi:hypothetical protein
MTFQLHNEPFSVNWFIAQLESHGCDECHESGCCAQDVIKENREAIYQGTNQPTEQ